MFMTAKVDIKKTERAQFLDINVYTVNFEMDNLI